MKTGMIQMKGFLRLILHFFKHLSVTGKVMLGIFTFLVVGIHFLPSPAPVPRTLLYSRYRPERGTVGGTYRFRRAMAVSRAEYCSGKDEAMLGYFRR